MYSKTFGTRAKKVKVKFRVGASLAMPLNVVALQYRKCRDAEETGGQIPFLLPSSKPSMVTSWNLLGMGEEGVGRQVVVCIIQQPKRNPYTKNS